MKPLIRYGVLGLDDTIIYWTLNKPASQRFVTQRIFILRKQR
jgi:hypothetical protein